MTGKKPSKATDGTVKTKSAKTGLKQAPARTRTRKASLSDPEPVPYMLTDEEIAQRAYALWESRGRPIGSQDEDWYRAKEELLDGR
jgi:hypothetical protein